jgi:hypothetical protein
MDPVRGGSRRVRKSTVSGRPPSVPRIRETLRLADRLLTDRLQLLGFARRSRGIYELDLHGWLGLNESLQGEVRFWPFVGARSTQVDQALARLGAPSHDPIATVQLGYLMPEAAARSWLFEGDLGSDEVTAADLVLNVERFAVPFFQQNRDLRNLSESVVRNSDEDSRAYLAPVLHYLLDQRELAEQAIDEELANDQSTAGSEYREFVARFLALLRADR